MTLPALELFDAGLPIQEIFGLPVHPLVIHGAVVLLPLAAAGYLWMFSSVKRSARLGGAVSFVAVLGAVFAFLSMASGRDLRAALGMGPRQHFDLGGWLPWFGLALAVLTVLLYLMDRKAKGARSVPGVIVGFVGVVVAVITIGWTIYTGHTGAELVWG